MIKQPTPPTPPAPAQRAAAATDKAATDRSTPAAPAQTQKGPASLGLPNVNQMAAAPGVTPGRAAVPDSWVNAATLMRQVAETLERKGPTAAASLRDWISLHK